MLTIIFLIIIFSVFISILHINILDKYSLKYPFNSTQHTGYTILNDIFSKYMISNVNIIKNEKLNAFDQRTNEVFLTDEVYNGNKINHIAVAAHEAMHAIQKLKQPTLKKLTGIFYVMLKITGIIVFPIVIIGSFFVSFNMDYVILTIYLILLVFYFFSKIALEFHATFKALEYLKSETSLTKKEYKSASLYLWFQTIGYLFTAPFFNAFS